MKIDKETKRQLRRKRLMDNKVYQVMGVLTRYMDRYYLDAIIGLIPGWGDVIALVSVIPFVYFSLFIIRSVPLTLAVLANALRDVFLGMLPFYVGDVIDFFHCSHVQNMEMMQGFVDGDRAVIRQVNRRVLQTVLVLILLLALIVATIWLLISFGSYLYSLLPF